jgi:hypothetical protein
MTIHVALPAGEADVDLYLPDDASPAPLVIVAHGFSRGRHNMAGWGRHRSARSRAAPCDKCPAGN